MSSRRFCLFATIVCLFAVLTLPSARAQDPQPKPSTGRLERIELPSRHVEPRPVDVWLPGDYAERVRQGQRFQVLYMHDGQMLFDPTITMNQQAWHVDVTLDRLTRSGRVPPTIVVAIWNRGEFRDAEYFPRKVLERLAPGKHKSTLETYMKQGSRSDDYLRYLVDELKPLIDSRYATRPERDATFIMGSSRGAVLSVYAMSEYPQVFGGAAGLSVHWIGTFERNAAIPMATFSYLSAHLPDPAGHRLYLDRGTETLDALYGPSVEFGGDVIRERGYTDANYMQRVFPGTDHSEKAWAARLDIPLLFLLAKPSS
ncbi:alpha/beta hydrolase [Massilia timonae]|uniref:Esterase family protein n=1 Tax=Massilia timonae TaxID=47229 RepID=A0A1S2N9K4_9BURK|nr:alpha/beta hydrolase-fold protein [Massilia timonae]OIJ41757.1 esterase family protein [Massilia timonae]